MLNSGRRYTEDCKNKALRELRRGRSADDVAEEFDVPVCTLRRWCREATKAGKPVLRFDGKPAIHTRKRHSEKMRAKGLQLLEAGKTKSEVASQLGVHISTVWWWAKAPQR